MLAAQTDCSMLVTAEPRSHNVCSVEVINNNNNNNNDSGCIISIKSN